MQKTETFHQMKLRKIPGNKWRDRITNIEVLLRVKIESLESIMPHHRFRWAGHLARIQDIRLPTQNLFLGPRM